MQWNNGKILERCMVNQADIKSELLCLGIRCGDGVLPSRLGGAGPADAGYFFIGDTEVSAPLKGSYVKNSPYSIHSSEGRMILLKDGSELNEIKRTREPLFYKQATPEGVPFYKIALAHGDSCIGTTVFQSCDYYGTLRGCGFCGIKISLQKDATIPIKSPESLAIVAGSARHDGFTHAIVTSGSLQDEIRLFRHLSECVSALKSKSMSIQVQFSPPTDLSLMNLLQDAGADSVAINIESFDEEVLQKVAPRKAEVGINGYLKAIDYAVRLFGSNQVISFMLAGLGEKRYTIISGAEELCSRGVYPFVVPFRPIPGTRLGQMNPVSPVEYRMLSMEVAGIVKTKGLSCERIKAGCGRCTCCSSVPDYEI